MDTTADARVPTAGSTKALSELFARVSSVLSPELHLVLERYEERQEKKRCHCKNSKCLKLYCECFAAGFYCDSSRCVCTDCANDAANEEKRQKAIQRTLQRNRGAFQPKIGTRDQKGTAGQHSKGCNCRQSLCLKKYCECFQAEVFCNDKCKCVGCQNFKGSLQRDQAMRVFIAKAKGPLVDSVGAAVKRKRGGNDAVLEAYKTVQTKEVKRIRIEEYRPLALNVRRNDYAAKQRPLEAGLRPAPLAGAVRQEDVERTCVRMLEDLYNLDMQYRGALSVNVERAKLPEQKGASDSELEPFICKEESSEDKEDDAVGHVAENTLAELQERAVLLRVRDFLQELANKSLELET